MAQQVTKSIIVGGEVTELYTMWRDFRNHPQFMEHIKSVTEEGPDRHHWVMEGPLNTKLEWTTETTRLETDRRIAWKTVEGDLKSSGQTTFTPLPKGQTEITVTTQTVASDDLAAQAATLLEDQEEMLEQSLRNFKAMVEKKFD